MINASGEVIATQTSEGGHLVEIPLPPGSYTITSTFVSATFCTGAEGDDNCVHPYKTYSVTMRAGYTVRENYFLGVP